MISKCLLVLLAVCFPIVSAPDESRTADIRKTIQGVKASIAQLQDQITVLESQLSLLEGRTPTVPDANTSKGSALVVTLLSPAESKVEPSGPTTKINDTARQQCTGITKKGSRCSRMAAPGQTTCWQH